MIQTTAERKEKLYSALDGVELSPQEVRFIDWITEWDDLTTNNLYSILLKVSASRRDKEGKRDNP